MARLIKDLDSESGSDAHRAAREIIRLAMDVQRQLAGEAAERAQAAARDQAEAVGAKGPAEDPLSRRVEALSDEGVEAILAILNGNAEGSPKGSYVANTTGDSTRREGTGRMQNGEPNGKPQTPNEP